MAKIPDVLLRQLDDAQRFQLETMSVIEQDLNWLKERVVLAFNMSLESEGSTERVEVVDKKVEALEQRFDEFVKKIDRAKMAPVRWIVMGLGIAAHTTIVVLVTLYLTQKFQGTVP